MSGKIYPKTINGKTYYYYQEGHREKLNPSVTSKLPGSGKSRVRIQSFYLGTAEKILKCFQEKQKPISVTHRSFGLVAAAYQMSVECGLIEILQKHIPGHRFETDRWLYFLITIINRIDHASSKNKMKAWIDKTILPDLLNIKSKHLTSKKFWYVTDDLISEEELKKKRAQLPKNSEDIFCCLNDQIFQDMEKEFFDRIRPLILEPTRSIVYDTTNFFTFFEAPERSVLARRGHNKEGRHNLRQVGLSMAVDQDSGLPFFHRIYRGNSQDVNTFSKVISDLVIRMKQSFEQVDELVLILDKGNNKKETFEFLSGKIEWIGSLPPSHHKELLKIPLTDYQHCYEGIKAFRATKEVFGQSRTLVMTYSDKLKRKQQHTFQNALDDLEYKIREKFSAYKKTPTRTPKGMISLVSNSRYKDYIQINVDETGLDIHLDQTKIAKRTEQFGKNLLFTSKAQADTLWIVKKYNEKYIIEDSFRSMKDVEIIRIRPLRHWTDSKIRAYVFCCVMALTLTRLMEHKIAQHQLQMSFHVLRQELLDFREIIMVYHDRSAERKITEGSTIQKKLFQIFRLNEILKKLNITLYDTF